MDYRDRHVVVTGGTGALGTAVVSALLAQGATCHVPTIDTAEVQRFPHRGLARVRLVEVATLADEGEVARFYAGVPRLWASIHIAGGFAMQPLAETGKTALMVQLEMNLVSAFLCCAAAARAMKSEGGRIVNVAARPALEPRLGAGMTAYTVSKAGVAALTVALAQELAADHILVNPVAPSILDTPANRAAMPTAEHALWPKVEEVAATILFLASPQNKVTRGAVVPVYGAT
ncbi:MAG TPA: SDR family NAD(P)-dependent oxidoreductase [Burkholderiales bacterium]|nr:SDR family NAD(P)-dependent oxidoreductase [Burkholderiales bacterium]